MSAFSILLVGNTTAKSSRRLQQEATKRGLVFDQLPSKYLARNRHQEFYRADRPEVSLNEYDLYLIRSPLTRQVPTILSWVQHLELSGKRIVERSWSTGPLPEDKIFPTSQSGLYHLPDQRMIEMRSLKQEIGEKFFNYPYVLKRLNTGLGRGVHLIRSDHDLRDRLEGWPETEFVLLQEYLPIEYDQRVLVVGDRVIGGMKRYKKAGEELLTTTPGGRRQPLELTAQEKAAALEATRLQGLEIAGLDMFWHQGRLYIIEVNASPQFRVLEKVTGLNVAGSLIEYLINR